MLCKHSETWGNESAENENEYSLSKDDCIAIQLSFMVSWEKISTLMSIFVGMGTERIEI